MSRSDNKISVGHCTEFCQAVRSIGAFNGEVPSHDELRSALGLDADGYLLGTLGELQERKGCSFCQIILEALNEAVLTSVAKESGLEAPRAEPVRITIRPGEHCLRLSHPLLCGTRVLFVENGTEKINSEQGPYVARVVKEEQVSTWLARSWLRQCEEKHGDSCFHLPLPLVSTPISKTFLYHLDSWKSLSERHRVHADPKQCDAHRSSKQQDTPRFDTLHLMHRSEGHRAQDAINK